MYETQESTRPRWYWNVPILLLVGILVPLGIRGWIQDDARYSWGTFCKQITYEIDYRWVMRDPDGTELRTKHWHADELRGEPSKYLSGMPMRLNVRYSLGAVKAWVAAYTKYMYENRARFMSPVEMVEKPQSEVIGFTAEVWYRVNVSRKLKDRDFTKLREVDETLDQPKKRLFFAYPPTIRDPLIDTEVSPTPADSESSASFNRTDGEDHDA